MKNKTLLTSLYVGLTIIVSIGLYLVFELVLPIHKSQSSQIIYWVAKGFSLISIIFVLVFILQKNEFVNKVIIIRTTVVWQILPFIIRLLLLESSDNQSIALSSVILAISLLGYIGLYFILITNSEKINETSHRFKGEIKQIKESSDYYDENNNFIGSNQRNEDDNA